MNVIKRFKRARNVAVTMQREEGLTLIEVLAVVVILGIVAAIAVPSVTRAIDQAKVNSTETTLGTLQSALDRYYFDEGQYPNQLAFLYESETNSTTPVNGYGVSSWNGPYIQGPTPFKDGWGKAIYYAPIPSSGPTTGYILISGDGNSVTVNSMKFQPNDGNYVFAAGGGTTTTSDSTPLSLAPQVGLANTGTIKEAINAAGPWTDQ